MQRVCAVVLAALASMLSAAAPAQGLRADALADALRAGGYVIVMRHASSPRARPDAASTAPGNVEGERQLDREGRETASAMGAAIKRLGIPVGEVLSSPTFRALQTARLLDVGEARAVAELGDGGQGMREDKEGARSAWLRAKSAEPAPSGSNRLVITHLPNLLGAFADAAAGMDDGESLIVRPQNGQAVVVGRVKIDEWPTLVRD